MIEIGKKPQDGRPGLDGNDGLDGKNGMQFHSGDGEPVDSLGVDGDVYLDTESCFLYLKKYGQWLFQCNLKGKKGDKGKDGTDGEDGKDGKDGTDSIGGWFQPGAGDPDTFVDVFAYDVGGVLVYDNVVDLFDMIFNGSTFVKENLIEVIV